ncbi:VOC family protein [Herbiconiux daphne]|uniref:VOC family protein n=1 Tax=Herbiconiux daphne TaxID=2970914 RepID=A0ABT2H8D7_9MICO|nr:VOC family protein [Herbiconiux daphne]MCS5736189.1 VOC family protein [Herbiconiux daphne]
MTDQTGQKPPKTYPQGVTCWVDTEQPDTAAAADFYGGLFGWTFENAMPPDAPAVYLIAQLDGDDVAAIGSAEGGGGAAGAAASWNTYIAVDDADAAAAAVERAGGTVVSGPEDAGPGGRTATCRDPQGAEFRLWQAYRRLGAQIANVPGSWNFSDLLTPDLAAAQRFYTEVFGWQYHDYGDGVEAMFAVPGYGDHLAATSDPEIYERQAGAPEGFADVVGGMHQTDGAEPPHWHVKFSVASRAEAIERAEQLGATLLETEETPWADLARLRDPQGAEFTVSEFHEPS